MLADLNHGGAWSTTDRGVTLFDQGVVWNVVSPRIFLNVFRRPPHQRIDLYQFELSIVLDYAGVSACWRLIAADARDPRTQARKHFPERFNLAQPAAFIRPPLPEFFSIQF